MQVNKLVPATNLTDYIMRLPNWNTNEIVIYKANTTGLAIQQLNSKQKNIALIGLIAQISIITGCPIPSDDRHLKILESEVDKFLVDNKEFSDLTVESILAAFRYNSAGKFDEKINHYQSLFNLDYLGAVLQKWIPLKRKIEAKAAKELVIKNLLETECNNELADLDIVQQSQNEWNRTGDYMFIESRAYNILCDQGKIQLSKDQKNNTLSQARAKIDVICRQHSGMFQFNGIPQVESIVSKKIAIAEYFNGGPINHTIDQLNTLQQNTPYL